MDPTQRASLQMQGEAWYRDIKPESEGGNRFVALLKNHGEKWYVQVGFAISYIFLSKYIHDFLNPSDDEGDED
jgi:hypothetical protein